MKKFLLSLMMIVGLVACGDKTQNNVGGNKQVVKIGAILPLSGPQASIGEAAKAGMQKALSDLNQNDLHYNYEMIFEDNQGKLPTMPSITNKVVFQDKVDTVATITSAFAKVIAPITDQNGVLLWDFSFEDENYQSFAKYAFNQGMSTQDIAATVYNEFVKNNYDNVAIFAENLGVIAMITADLKKKLEQNQMKYVVSEFNPGERDFRITIAKNKEAGFTKFFVIALPPEREIVVKQLTESSINKADVHVITADMQKATSFHEEMRTVTYNPGTKEFNDSMYNEYNLGSTFGSAAFYDYVNMVVDAYEHLYKESSKPTTEEVTAYIHSRKKYKCMSGECEVKDNGFIVNKPIIRFCKDGEWHNI